MTNNNPIFSVITKKKKTLGSTVNVKMGFSLVSSSIASSFDHVLARHFLFDFKESTRSVPILETNLNVGVALDQFPVEIPTDIYRMKCWASA